MKNLTKVLALVLTVAMLVSFAAIAGAAFPDQADIAEERVEAASILNALGVLKGDGKGNFNPKAILSRAEAAKIACVLDLGEDKVSNIYAAMTSFTDMDKAPWAKAYVGYCVANGIIAGTSATTFNPLGQLTGTAFAKILLTVLDYDADVEGFVGAGWDLKVLVAAENAKLWAGLEDIDPNAGLTREDAAQMMMNALKAKKVASYDATTKKAVLSSDKLMKNFDLKEGVAGTDEYGRPTVEWKKGAKVIATFDKEPVAEYTVPFTGATLRSDLGLKADAAIKVDGSDFAKTDKAGAQGTQTFVYEDAENEYSTVEIETFLGQVTTKANDKGIAKVTVDGTAYDAKTALAKDTYVLVTFTTDSKIATVEEASSKEAAVTGVKNSTKEVKLGAAYNKFAANYEEIDAINLFDGTTIATSLINSKKNYTFYFDTYGNIIGIANVKEDAPVAEAAKYAYVVRTWTESVKGIATDYALIVTDECEELEVKVASKPAADAVYTYTVKDGKYTFGTAVTTAALTKAENEAKIGSNYANAATKYFIKKVDAKGNVSFENATGFKGIALPSGSEGFVEAKDGKALFVYVSKLAKAADPADEKDTANLYYVLAVNTGDRTDKDIYTADVLVKGEKKTINVKAADSLLATKKAYELTFDKDGNATAATEKALTTAKLEAKIDDAVFYAGGKQYTLADDAVILTIEGTKITDTAWSKAAVNDNVVLFADKNAVVSVLYIIK